MIQQPLDLGAREIRVEQQPGPFGYHRPKTRRPQIVTDRRRPPVLPDNRAVQRLAGVAVPEQGRLALVGDANCRRHARLGNHLAHGRNHGLPQILRLMLHPAGCRVMLGKLALSAGHHPQACIKHNRPGRGGALVNGHDMAHPVLRFCPQTGRERPDLKAGL